MQWPSYFPDDCPRKEAEPKKIKVYRLVNHDPPTEKDFIPSKKRKPNEKFSDDCLASGLSCYTSYKEIIQLKEMTPYFRRKKIAVGFTHTNFGVVLRTPASTGKSHHTYWICDGASPHVLFKVVREGEEQ
ncbi:hypothetical protein [Hydrogenibacillus schlegelii]|uniref:hypothetical protein n=1 Tax=Hydrogenibacillus schlegelii TaxID=1484 RepID=UPI00235487E7|nr:hypothetical protein [Hydrogenibacillus schlegelii]